MKVNEIIVGSKKRKSRNNREHRITQKDLYKANLKENARIQHLEDLILRDGVAGLDDGDVLLLLLLELYLEALDNAVAMQEERVPLKRTSVINLLIA